MRRVARQEDVRDAALAMKARAVAEIRRKMIMDRISTPALARRLGTSAAAISRFLDPEDPGGTMAFMVGIARALGLAVRLEFDTLEKGEPEMHATHAVTGDPGADAMVSIMAWQVKCAEDEADASQALARSNDRSEQAEMEKRHVAARMRKERADRLFHVLSGHMPIRQVIGMYNAVIQPLVAEHAEAGRRFQLTNSDDAARRLEDHLDYVEAELAVLLHVQNLLYDASLR
ncbi:MAG: hypothetical protein ABMB14_32450 [Myxococcota bacterium]